MKSEIFNFGIFFIFQRCTDRNYRLKLISNDEKDAIKRVSKEELKTRFRAHQLQDRGIGVLKGKSEPSFDSLQSSSELSFGSLQSSSELSLIPSELSSVILFVCLFVCLVGFLMSLSTTRLYRGRAPRQSV